MAFDIIGIEQSAESMVRNTELISQHLDRPVTFDYYLSGDPSGLQRARLLLVNDGQDLVKMNFSALLSSAMAETKLLPLVVVAIHCGPDRINEYGVASSADYLGRGAKARDYEQFILTELLPRVYEEFPAVLFTETGFAGFSLGGLSAIDIAWNHSEIFSRVGVFSGSLWWRSLSQNDKEYYQGEHRMMHAQLRRGSFIPGLKFFFECGEEDEVSDRNKNSVIDSIDDTIDLMRELVKKGYREGRDIRYLQLPDGRHDVPSWAKSLPFFLRWGYSA